MKYSYFALTTFCSCLTKREKFKNFPFTVYIFNDTFLIYFFHSFHSELHRRFLEPCIVVPLGVNVDMKSLYVVGVIIDMRIIGERFWIRVFKSTWD